MPLSRISGRTGPLSSVTYRELLAHKKLAERAVRRGRNVAEAEAMIRRIDAELETRRIAKFERNAGPDF